MRFLLSPPPTLFSSLTTPWISIATYLICFSSASPSPAFLSPVHTHSTPFVTPEANMWLFQATANSPLLHPLGRMPQCPFHRNLPSHPLYSLRETGHLNWAMQMQSPIAVYYPRSTALEEFLMLLYPQLVNSQFLCWPPPSYLSQVSHSLPIHLSMRHSSNKFPFCDFSQPQKRTPTHAFPPKKWKLSLALGGKNGRYPVI